MKSVSHLPAPRLSIIPAGAAPGRQRPQAQPACQLRIRKSRTIVQRQGWALCPAHQFLPFPTAPSISVPSSPAMDSIPFYFDSIHGGLSSCAGLLHVTREGLRCEYRVDLGGLGLKTDAKEASVALDEIASIEFKRGWLRGKAVIRPKSLKLLDRFPTSGDDSIVLYFKRKDRSLAGYLMSEIALKLSQSRLDF